MKQRCASAPYSRASLKDHQLIDFASEVIPSRLESAKLLCERSAEGMLCMRLVNPGCEIDTDAGRTCSHRNHYAQLAKTKLPGVQS